MKKVYQTMLISLIVNGVLVMIKCIVGVITHCKSLMADGIHSLSDLSTDAIAIFGQKLSKPDADKEHPYGHGKIEYITSIIIGTIIMIMGLGLIVDVIKSELVLPNYNIAVIVVVLFTILVKYIVARFITLQGKTYRNSILIASGRESSADVLSSIGVLFVALLSMLSNQIVILKYADKLGGLIISFFIIKSAFKTIHENIIAILGEGEQDEIIIKEVEKTVKDIEGVNKVDNITLIKYGSYYRADLAVEVNSNYTLKEAHDIAHSVEKGLLETEGSIKYVIVHINPSEENDS